VSRQQIQFPVQQVHIATPSPPPAGSLKLYPKADNVLYKLTSAGVESAVGVIPDPLVVNNATVNQALNAGTLRLTAALAGSPFTLKRLTVYEDAANWGYLTYANDANMRLVYSRTAAGQSLLFGTTTATDGTGTFTETARLTGGGVLSAASLVASSSITTPGTIGITTNGNPIYWLDTNSRIMSSSRTMYFDEYNAGWSWRNSANSFAQAMGLTGAGALNTGGAITSAGNITATGGLLTLGADATIQRWNPAEVRFGGTGGITVNGKVTLETGNLTVSGGTLSVSGAAALSSTLTVSGTLGVAGRVSFTGNTTVTIANAAGHGSLEIAPSGGGASLIAFHRPGVFAANFGLDTDNVFKVGGWSMGAASYKVLDARDYSEAAAATKLVMRDANGYIRGTYINLSADVQGVAPAYVAGQNGDGYLRWYPKSLLAPPALQWAQLTTSAAAAGSGAWTNCTFSGSGNAYVRNDSSQMTILKPGYYSIFAAGGGYYAVGVRIYADAVVVASQTGNSNDYCPCGTGWTGYVASWVQIHRYGQVSQGAATFHMTFVPTSGYPG
jgi:hypothetical protein